MKRKTCCFTGHREIPFYQKRKIFKRTLRAVEEHIHRGYLYFGTGGALGFDTIAAKVVIKLKKRYPNIRLILVLPCFSQSQYWNPIDIAAYEEIKQQADKIVYISQEYTNDCMIKRNCHLVDNSSACICYLTKNTGGTFYTVCYAHDLGLPVVNIAK